MKSFASIWLWGLGLLFLLLAPLGCNTSNSSTDFEISYVDHDSLTQFDSVVVLLEREGQAKPDTLFKGKVKSADDLKNLPVPGDLEGSIKITIQAFNNGELALERQNHLDTDKNQLVGTDLIKSPVGKIRFDSSFMQLKVGDTANLPKISIEPKEWENKTISYSFEEIKVVALIAKDRLVGLFHGTARIIAHIEGDSTVTDTLTVQVVDPITEQIVVTVTPESLSLAAQGAIGTLKATVIPTTAPIKWLSRDTSIFTIDSLGRVKGLAAGTAWAVAQSTEDTASADSAKITVEAPVTLDSLRFSKSSLLLFVGGASDTVEVRVFPANADAGFGVKVIGEAVAWTNRRYVPVLAGQAIVIAFSLKDSTKTDTLLVTVEESKAITSVKVSPDSLRLFIGGPKQTMAATIEPASANQSVVWRVLNPAIASVNEAGEATALSPGQTKVLVVSLADSTKRDTAEISVVQDIPKLRVGASVVVSPGTEVTVDPIVEQEFGGIEQFYWDLDGDSVWDDSSKTISTLKKTYSDLGEFVTHFKVRDGEGNTAEATRTVTVTKGPLVVILSPIDGFVTKESTVDVNWEIDGVKQTVQTQEPLTQDGPKTITRTAKDASGNVTSISITIFRDTKAPERPLVFAASPVNTKSPTFSWRGAGGGANVFRYQMDAQPGDAQSPTTDTTLVWPADLTEGGHTLFVQERDTAGNWSASGQKRVVIDLNAPAAPTVTRKGSASTNQIGITFAWSAADEGALQFRYRVDQDKFDVGFTSLADTTVTLQLASGRHTLYVQQLDSAGNASKSGSASVDIDTTGPAKPVLTSLTGIYSVTGKPTWQWTTGGNAGHGEFRFRLDTADLSTKTFATTNSFTPANALSEGAHWLFVQEQDSVGNVSPIESLSVLVDTQKPAAPVCSEPSDNAWVATRTPTWKWSQVSGGDGRFHAFIAGHYAPDTASRITATSLTSPVNLPDGQRILGLKAYDAAGNVSDLVTCRLRVDVTPPAAPLAGVNAKHVNTLRPLRNFSGNNASGLQFWARVDNTDTKGGTALPFAATSSFTPSVDLSEGKHILYVQVVDSAGNGSSLMADTFTVDITAPAAPVLTVMQPSVSVLCAGDEEGLVVRRQAQAGIAKVLYSWTDSALLKSETLDPLKADITLPPGGCLTNGWNRLYLQEFDSAGNTTGIAKSALIQAHREEVQDFKVQLAPSTPAIDFKMMGNMHVAAYIGPDGFPLAVARKGWDDNWATLNSAMTRAATSVRLAVDAANNSWALAGFTANTIEIQWVRDMSKAIAVELPTQWGRTAPSWLAMDFSNDGTLYIAFADYDGKTLNGLTVCVVDEKGLCNVVGERGFTKTAVTHVFLTAKPSLLVAVRNASDLPEVFGLQTDLFDPTNPRTLEPVKTGMEGVKTGHFGLGVVKNTVGLMYFAYDTQPTFQFLTYTGKEGNLWSAGDPNLLPPEVGAGLAVMDVGPQGRPFFALKGKVWGFDDGAWKSLRADKFDLGNIAGIDLKVGDDGIPYIIASPAVPQFRAFRLGFDLPHVSLPQK